MIENAPVLVEELDRRNATLAASPGDREAEMAFWQAATRLGIWYVVNRGTPEDPRPSGFTQPGIGNLLGVYSTRDRAGAVAGPGSTFLGVPMPQALRWLASFGEQGVAGIVMDHPGPWLPLANLSYLERWVPAAQAAVTSQPVTVAPEVQAAAEAYVAAQSDPAYAEVVRRIAGGDLLVVIDPQGDGTAPTSIVNHRGERILLAFTDSTRLASFYDGKAVEMQRRPGADLLRSVGRGYDVLILDAQHPASFAATPGSIRDALGGPA